MPALFPLDSRLLNSLYEEAKDLEGLETKIAKFWMAFLHREFPANRDLYIVQEQNPSDESKRRVDCKVFCWNNQDQETNDILYVEFKRADLKLADRQEAVNQVAEYCNLHFKVPPSTKTLTCMVCYGTTVTFWEAKPRLRSRACQPNFEKLIWYDAKTYYQAVHPVLKHLRALAKRFGQ
ncbi:hypothetical protein AWENTII_007003 [Aspergillus wentii]